MIIIKKTLKYLGLFFVFILAWFLLSEPGFFVLEKTRNFNTSGSGEGVGVYFINLDSSIERKNHILPKIKALGYPYKRIVAVDGRKLTQVYIKEILDRKFREEIGDTPMRLGELGCSLSHIKTWESFLKSPYKCNNF
jgi:hypothetical protein